MTLARHLRTHRDVTVMTNGLNIAWELANAAGINVLLTGGQLRQQSLSLQGSQAEASLNPTASTRCSWAWTAWTCSSG
jgi:DeoR family transcriptional regulator of aga operon